MRLAPTRRRFVRNAAAGSLCGLLPQRVFSDAPAAERVTVRLDSEIGLVRPEFHGSDLVITFVNPRYGHYLTVDCTIAGMNGVKPLNATAQVLHHPDLNAANTFDNPDAVVPKPHAINTEGSAVKVGVPGLSIVTATVRLGRAHQARTRVA